VTPAVQPLFVLADSRPLFVRDPGSPLRAALEGHARRSSRAVYLGASSGDEPAFADLFVAAMEHHAIRDARAVSSSYSLHEQELLETADLVVLGGGDVMRGWRVFEATGIRAAVERRYQAGGTIIGVSAGAVQCGTHALVTSGDSDSHLVATFGWCPFVVAAHDEANDWKDLGTAMLMLGEAAEGFGVPFGCGLVYHPDNTVEAMGGSLDRFVSSPRGVSRQIVVPGIAVAASRKMRER
jgi:cyanophycinase-like exopeptidase